MLILGIDTAMRCTGYGVISAEPDNYKAIDCGVIKNSQKLSHSGCLKRLSGGIKELISKHHFEAAVIEGVFYAKNVRTTMILGYARGCVMTVLAEANIPIFAYSPKEVKMGVGGSGFASKQQVATVISSILNLNIEGIEKDATDALALTVCHANRSLRAGSELFLSKTL